MKEKEADFEILPIERQKHVRFYTSVDPGSFVAPHWHDALEIIYLEEGTLTVTDNSGTTKMRPGSCILIDANFVHSTKCISSNRAVVFQIPLIFLDQFIPNLENLRFGFNSTRITDPKKLTKIKFLTDKIERMQYLNDEKPDGYALLFNGLLYEVLYQLYHDFSSKVYESVSGKHLKNVEQLIPLLKYVGDHYTQHISIEEAAGITGFEPRYFCRFFKRKMGVTFLEYQNDIRLVYIVRDLLETDDQIREILERHGFTNYKLFRRLFAEQFHMTPTELRKQHQQPLTGSGVPFVVGSGSQKESFSAASELKKKMK